MVRIELEKEIVDVQALIGTPAFGPVFSQPQDFVAGSRDIFGLAAKAFREVGNDHVGVEDVVGILGTGLDVALLQVAERGNRFGAIGEAVQNLHQTFTGLIDLPLGEEGTGVTILDFANARRLLGRDGRLDLAAEDVDQPDADLLGAFTGLSRPVALRVFQKDIDEMVVGAVTRAFAGRIARTEQQRQDFLPLFGIFRVEAFQIHQALRLVLKHHGNQETAFGHRAHTRQGLAGFLFLLDKGLVDQRELAHVRIDELSRVVGLMLEHQGMRLQDNRLAEPEVLLPQELVGPLVDLVAIFIALLDVLLLVREGQGDLGHLADALTLDVLRRAFLHRNQDLVPFERSMPVLEVQEHLGVFVSGFAVKGLEFLGQGFLLDRRSGGLGAFFRNRLCFRIRLDDVK